jgi:hypothetical protein
MTDREKIQIWLEKCYGICNEDTECDECPFFTLNDGGCTSRLREVLTRELLKEQTIRPVQGASPRLFFCPECEKQIVDLFVYCPYCGKRVLWE